MSVTTASTPRNIHCLLLTLLLVLLVVLLPCQAAADNGSTLGEYSLKAVLVYNFAQFTQWPDSTLTNGKTPLRITVFGDSDLTADFDLIDGRSVDGRKIMVSHTNDPTHVSECDILFLADVERDQWPLVFSALGNHPILTIGEMNGFLEAGGIINFHLVDGRIRFQVNLDQARHRGLSISSRILKLATSVINHGTEEK